LLQSNIGLYCIATMQDHDLLRWAAFRFAARTKRGVELLKSTGIRNDLLIARQNARGALDDHAILKEGA